jgi:hypothetical protein
MPMMKTPRFNPHRVIAWAILLLALCVLQCREVAFRVEPLGVFGQSRLASVLGQDGVTPMQFSEDITTWTFGDTILGAWKGEVSTAATFSEKTNITDMISNSLAFTERITETNIGTLTFSYNRQNGQVAPFLPAQAGEDPRRVRLWPVDGVRLGNRLYVFYMKIAVTEPGNPFGFVLTGTGLARWDIPPDWEVGRPVAFVRLPDLFGENAAFGDAVLLRNGYLYVVGRPARSDHKAPIRIARVRPERIEERGAYEFLRADGSWTGDFDWAADFLNDVLGECSLSYNATLGCYVIIYCSLTNGEVVMVRFADFTELVSARKDIIYRIPPPAEQGNKRLSYYSAKEICVGDASLYAVYMNPSDYQPYLLRITVQQ